MLEFPGRCLQGKVRREVRWPHVALIGEARVGDKTERSIRTQTASGSWSDFRSEPSAAPSEAEPLTKRNLDN